MKLEEQSKKYRKVCWNMDGLEPYTIQRKMEIALEWLKTQKEIYIHRSMGSCQCGDASGVIHIKGDGHLWYKINHGFGTKYPNEGLCSECTIPYCISHTLKALSMVFEGERGVDEKLGAYLCVFVLDGVALRNY
jgi:hypothetical protein